MYNTCVDPQPPVPPVFSTVPAMQPSSPNPKIPFLVAAGILIFAVGVGVGTLVSKYISPQPSLPIVSTPLPTVTSAPEADPTANWKTYTDPGGKFKLQYPKELTSEDQNSRLDANEYTQLFRVFTTFKENDAPGFVIRVRNGLNLQQLEKEDFDDMVGHVDYRIIKREEINLSGKKAVKIKVFVGPPEDYKENSGTIDIYSDIDSQESLSIRQLGVNTVQFDQILSTFRFVGQ